MWHSPEVLCNMRPKTYFQPFLADACDGKGSVTNFVLVASRSQTDLYICRFSGCGGRKDSDGIPMGSYNSDDDIWDLYIVDDIGNASRVVFSISEVLFACLRSLLFERVMGDMTMSPPMA